MTRTAHQLAAARDLAGEVARLLDLDAHVRLWDGSRIPLGREVTGPFEIVVASPGAIGSLVRWPTLDTLIRRYVAKDIDFTGGTLIDLGLQLERRGRAIRGRDLDLPGLLWRLRPFLLAYPGAADAAHAFEGEAVKRARSVADNEAFVRFHYDLSNDFYALFLDPEMVYSCAYFTDWENDLATAQTDKLEMICRKLRLAPGHRLLDVGCGWGGLVCHAARHHGVTATGITLSEEQLDYARDKVGRLGLAERVELRHADYRDVTGTFDRIASIGMYEHIGRANIDGYMRKIRALLAEDGVFLNHAIAHRAPKPTLTGRRRLRPEQRAIVRYIFPGGELDDIGHSIRAMERAGFEVHDVEAWREHYARTCQLWCERLTAEKTRAINLVGEEKYRIWAAYLAGCSLAFRRGTLRIFQTLVTKTAKRRSPLPPTRADLYR
jgi:cyclopropane-fatty-acyl-phospholipid synthase